MKKLMIIVCAVAITALENNRIAVNINCHFTIPYASTKAIENKQTVILAINNAVKKHNIEFV